MHVCSFGVLLCLVGGLPAAGPDPLKATVPALIKALKDPDQEVRTLAQAALVNLDERAVPALIQVLEGNDKALKVQAANALAQMSLQGRRHVAALPALLKMMEDDDTLVRRAAVAAIGGIAVKALEKPPAQGKP
jgi:HEAT repeat protein